MSRPFVSPDPGPTVLRWGWFLWLTWAVVGTGLLGEDREGGGFALGLVLSAPFWALWLLWPMYRGWAFWTRLARRAGGQAWHGNYYEFDGRPVRVLFEDDRILFVAEDVFDALGLDGRRSDADLVRDGREADGVSELPGSGLAFSESGLAAWLDRRGSDPAALKFRGWVEQQVIEPLRRGRERA